MTEKRQNLVGLLVKIPLFHGLGPDQCLQVLKISHQKSFKPGEKIYAAGTPGDEMLILLQGRVKILVRDNREVAQVEAIDTVGEMEIIGANLRVADVVADGEVSGLTVGEGVLDDLFHREPTLGIQLLRNIVSNLSGKLAATDQTLAARLAHRSGTRVWMDR